MQQKFYKTTAICRVCGRVIEDRGSKKSDFLCARHYRQWKKHGRFLDKSPRSAKDPNEITVEGGSAYISLYDKLGNVVAKAIIDSDSVELVKHRKWVLSETNGVITKWRVPCDDGKVRMKTMQLSHAVLGLGEDDVGNTRPFVKFADNNRLNCRRWNLEVV